MTYDYTSTTHVEEMLKPAGITTATNSSPMKIEGALSYSVIVTKAGERTYAVDLLECDTANGTFTAVASKDIIGTPPTGANGATILGYKGNKAFIAARITPGSGSATINVGVLGVKMGCRYCPTV